MKFKDLFKVLVNADYININVVEKGTLKIISSETISRLSSLEKYFDMQVHCIHSFKCNNAYIFYIVTLYY